MIQARLLLIEADRTLRDAVQGAFIRRGWEVVMAESPDDGVALLRDYDPDWIVVDWSQLLGTPDRSGMASGPAPGSAFLYWLRAGRKRARLAALTEGAGLAGTSLAPRLRPEVLFPKPVDPEALYLACAELGKRPLAAC